LFPSASWSNTTTLARTEGWKLSHPSSWRESERLAKLVRPLRVVLRCATRLTGPVPVSVSYGITAATYPLRSVYERNWLLSPK
jgi:hypothetical protein